MTYIKKLTMKGFKSFVKKTEIPLNQNINVVLGPNGSGKSNISDALCFVLGRLNIKSMRASNTTNLIFMGNKFVPSAKEAFVEVIFDNSKRTFSIEKEEISIKRIVRRGRPSIYKIDGNTKKRQEVLSLLAQAGIDPNGFNFVLQGEIQNFVRMHPEERRKVIEEVSGISIYEFRKEKSLKELDKTEDKLKEVSAILRERTNYMNNLEKERQQALRYQSLQEDVKRYKASIIFYDLTKKEKESKEIDSQRLNKEKDKEKIKREIIKIETSIKNTESKISSLESIIKKSTGIEQEKLNKEIANLRADLAGMEVRLENQENKLSEISKQKNDFKESIKKTLSLLEELGSESPRKKNKQEDIETKKQELEDLERKRKKFYIIKSDLKSLKERIQDKKNLSYGYRNESDFLLNQIKSISKDLFDRKTTPERVDSLKISLEEKRSFLEDLNKKEAHLEKITYSNESEIERQDKLMNKISGMDICPLCKSKITEEHIHSISTNALLRIESLKNEIENSDKSLSEISEKKRTINNELEQIKSEIFNRESDILYLSNIEEKKEQIKLLEEKYQKTEKEISFLENNRKKLEKEIVNYEDIEKKYEDKRLEVQDLSLRSEENINSEISFKQRELERWRSSLKHLVGNEEDILEEISSIKQRISEKRELLNEKRRLDDELNKKFQKLISERENLQKNVRDYQIELSNKRNNISRTEQEINEFKINLARVNAERENLKSELSEFGSVSIIKKEKSVLNERLIRTQESLSRIGSVNLRSLEVYDSVKKEYDLIREKVEIIGKEKEGILKIISEIDIKKKKTFMKTLESLNEIFSRNFSSLNSKGEASLQLENKKEPFESGSGVQIVVKMGHGKYFDVTSLSGGEQSLIALSLIFAIQELKPYYFYIFDEIDAALDKRNSERLGALLQKYMEKGQYIVITHNDEIISNASYLFGVSMHEGVSKITSLKI